MRESPEHDGNSLKYYLSTPEGRLFYAHLFNAKRDPLKSIGNAYLKLVKENGKDVIKGMMIEEDWVEVK